MEVDSPVVPCQRRWEKLVAQNCGGRKQGNWKELLEVDPGALRGWIAKRHPEDAREPAPKQFPSKLSHSKW